MDHNASKPTPPSPQNFHVPPQREADKENARQPSQSDSSPVAGSASGEQPGGMAGEATPLQQPRRDSGLV